MPTPRPNRPVRHSKTGRPIMALFDLLGRRWTLRVLWELRAPVPAFRALQAQCHGMSSSVLSRRLAELTEAGIVAAQPAGGYALTAEGEALLTALWPLDQWAQRWADRVRR
jgi:DNA-binding HxlR family transcriptional regulator